MSHQQRQNVINSVGGNWFAWAADIEALYRKDVMGMEADEHCLNCGSKHDLVDKLCWACITEMESRNS